MFPLTENVDQASGDKNATVITSFGKVGGYMDFRSYVERSGWDAHSDLWSDHWNEFVRDYLQRNLECETHRGAHREERVYFERVFHLLTEGRNLPPSEDGTELCVDLYLEASPEKMNWAKEGHLCRLIYQVFHANVTLAHGVFDHLSDYDLADHRNTLHNIWKYVREESTAWASKNHPPKKSRTSNRRSKMFGMSRKRAEEGRKKLLSGPNKNGGELDVVWQRVGKKSLSEKFANLNKTTCPKLMDDIVTKFELNAEQTKNAVISFCEDYNNLEHRFGKPLRDITAAELCNEHPRLNHYFWAKIQDRAMQNTMPLLAKLITEVPKCDEGKEDERSAKRRRITTNRDESSEESEDEDAMLEGRIPDYATGTARLKDDADRTAARKIVDEEDEDDEEIKPDLTRNMAHIANNLSSYVGNAHQRTTNEVKSNSLDVDLSTNSPSKSSSKCNIDLTGGHVGSCDWKAYLERLKPI